MRFKHHAQPAAQFAAGHFTQLVRQHDWPPGFVSAWPAKGVNTALLAQASRANVAARIGFAGVSLGLPGAVEHIERWRQSSLSLGRTSGA